MVLFEGALIGLLLPDEAGQHTFMRTGARRFERSFLWTHRKFISTIWTTSCFTLVETQQASVRLIQMNQREVTGAPAHAREAERLLLQQRTPGGQVNRQPEAISAKYRKVQLRMHRKSISTFPYHLYWRRNNV